jgi:hypothetical protein
LVEGGFRIIQNTEKLGAKALKRWVIILDAWGAISHELVQSFEVIARPLQVRGEVFDFASNVFQIDDEPDRPIHRFDPLTHAGAKASHVNTSTIPAMRTMLRESGRHI